MIELISGETEKVVRIWDPRTGSKSMKLRGHIDNTRALLLDSTGRIAVHTDSVWALASTPTFSHVYSSGRDFSLYLTDLSTRENILLCTKEHPISLLAFHDDNIWVATTDSSVDRRPAEGQNPQKVFQRGDSFLAGNLSFSRARVSLEGTAPTPVFKEPIFTIPGTPAIVQYEILNKKRHVLTRDTAGSIKLWDITILSFYAQVSYDEKKEQLFEMVTIPSWFTVDSPLGSLSVHLDTPQCFSAEMYSADLKITGKPEDDKINLGLETLKGLLAHWMAKRRQKLGLQTSANGNVLSGKVTTQRSLAHSRIEVDGNAETVPTVYPPFELSTVSPPSIITEGSQGGPWRKKITELYGTEDEKHFPWWVLDCGLNNQLPSRENTKCSFHLHPCEGSAVQILTQGKLSAPRILRIQKVINYVKEKMVLDKPIDSLNTIGSFAPGIGGQLQHSSVGDGLLCSGLKPWKNPRHSIEILCNNQVLSPDTSLSTVRAYIWKKPEDLVLNYRVIQRR
ncbi:WD repeat-containing protein 48-like [Hibiscus syriacus]|uniref:WD repeat-containing protein 48-like n=1 Tax=Hibiscus syriacus TaxID=106335 RepID=UPI00192417B4|nr:WD repeat-containing protein 48-like [Hibiscus syriacus]